MLSGGEPVVTFTLSTAEGLRATVTSDGPAHPDLLDELSRRVVRIFVDANASLPDQADDAE